MHQHGKDSEFDVGGACTSTNTNNTNQTTMTCNVVDDDDMMMGMDLDLDLSLSIEMGSCNRDLNNCHNNNNNNNNNGNGNCNTSDNNGGNSVTSSGTASISTMDTSNQPSSTTIGLAANGVNNRNLATTTSMASNRFISNTFPLISRSSIKRPLSFTHEREQKTLFNNSFYLNSNNNNNNNNGRDNSLMMIKDRHHNYHHYHHHIHHNNSSNNSNNTGISGPFRARSKTIHSSDSYSYALMGSSFERRQALQSIIECRKKTRKTDETIRGDGEVHGNHNNNITVNNNHHRNYQLSKNACDILLNSNKNHHHYHNHNHNGKSNKLSHKMGQMLNKDIIIDMDEEDDDDVIIDQDGIEIIDVDDENTIEDNMATDNEEVVIDIDNVDDNNDNDDELLIEHETLFNNNNHLRTTKNSGNNSLKNHRMSNMIDCKHYHGKYGHFHRCCHSLDGIIPLNHHSHIKSNNNNNNNNNNNGNYKKCAANNKSGNKLFQEYMVNNDDGTSDEEDVKMDNRFLKNNNGSNHSNQMDSLKMIRSIGEDNQKKKLNSTLIEPILSVKNGQQTKLFNDGSSNSSIQDEINDKMVDDNNNNNDDNDNDDKIQSKIGNDSNNNLEAKQQSTSNIGPISINTITTINSSNTSTTTTATAITSAHIPTEAEKEQFQRSLNSATTLVFHRRSGLPLTSSPAPIRKSGTCFDFDSSLTSVNAIKKALFHKDPDGKDVHPVRSKLSLSASTTTTGLLGNFEESVLNGRLDPASIVHGFSAEIGASGSFCPPHKTFPVTVFFYTLQDTDKGEKISSPYLGHINLGEKGYHVPRQGTVQVTLFNPNGTVVKMFVVRYDLTDMPPNSRTFVRQRTLFMPSDANEHHVDSRKWLRYLIHLRFQSSKSGRIRLHTDIRILVFRKHDLDVATMNGGAHYELRSFVQMPSNPKYSKNIKT